MFLYRADTDEDYRQDRRRVMEEVLRAVVEQRTGRSAISMACPRRSAALCPEPVGLRPARLALPAPSPAPDVPKPAPHSWDGPLRGR